MFEYHYFHTGNPKEIPAILNAKGREKWELVNFCIVNAIHYFVFKRKTK